MKCDICHKNEASVYIEDVYKQKVVKRHICMHCAMGLLAMKVHNSPLGDFLDIFKAGLGKNEDSSVDVNKKEFVCPQCGTSYEEVEKTRKVGCGMCYVTFRDFLDPLLFPNGYKHPYRGHFPKDLQKTVNHRKKLAELKSELEDLLAFEDYEQAARVRDEIKDEIKKEKKRTDK